MSLNAAISQHYLPEVQALLQLLEQYIVRRAGAPTVEEQRVIEAEAVGVFERLLQQEKFVNEVLAGEHPDFNDLGRVYGDLWFQLEVNSAKIQTLADMFLNRFNSQQLILMDLTSLMKRIRQKRSTLTLWTRDKAKFVVSERFLNFDNLDTKFTSLQECAVDTNQGVLTLPIRNRQRLLPVSATVGGKSNGIPGNSDIDVQTNNSNPQFAINQNPANWFEYERLDGGPLDLSLVINFSNPEIVNHIVIEPVNLGLSLTYEIQDITFTLSGGQEVSIHELVSSDFDNDFFTVKSAGNDSAWVLSFLPVETTAVVVSIRQRQPYQIKMLSPDGREVLRKRLAIAIKDIGLYRLEYEDAGGINSKALSLPGGLYVAASLADYWPTNTNFFTPSLELSLDNGQTWLSPGDNPFSGATQLMQGDETAIIWRLSLERNDDAFENMTSFNETDNPLLNTKSILRRVSRFESPVELTLPETPLDSKVFVLQPQVARRGDKYRGLFIGTGSGQATSFELPLNIIKQGIDPDTVRIFVERVEYDRAVDNTIIGPTEWAFADDYREVIFGSALASGSNVSMVLDEEIMSFEERSDGYYHTMKLLFDPDKENITVKYVPRKLQRHNAVLPRDKKIIDLGVTNILDGSFKLTSDLSLTYTEVDTRSEVHDAEDQDYYVDYKNGILYFSQPTGADTLRVVFAHKTEQEISDDDFNVVIEQNVPTGIRIHKRAFEAQAHTDTLGQPLAKVINVVTGRYGQRDDDFAAATNASTLSYDCIVKGTLSVSDDFLDTTVPLEEVDFQDGRTEFLGLIPMNQETTVAIEAAVGESWVEFNLAAGAAWYRPFGVDFNDATTFANKVGSRTAVETGSIGDYYITNRGRVIVNVGAENSLDSGIEINYFYRDPSFDPVNKYSVDYENGIIYSHTDQVDGATVEYRAACYKIEYDIAHAIRSQKYDPELKLVTVRSENLLPINNLMKVIWTEAPPVSDLVQLRNYFSPLIYLFALRFN